MDYDNCFVLFLFFQIYYFKPNILAVVKKKKRIGKNPDVDTSFLPDRDREVSCSESLNFRSVV